MKKSFLIVFSFLLLSSSVYAQTPTGSEIRDAVQKQVQQELSDIKQAVAKKAFVGSITAKTDSTYTLNNLASQPRTIVVTADATIKLLNGSDGTPADLKVNDYVLAMGSVDSTNKMTVSRLLVIKAPTPDKRTSVFVTVTKVTGSTLTVTDSKNQTWTVKTSGATFTGVANGKLSKEKVADVAANAKLIIVGTPNSTTNSFSATDVHLIQ